MISRGRKCVVFVVVCVCLLIFITYGKMGNGTLIASVNNYSINESKEMQTTSREPLNISRNSNRRSETNDTLILTREPLNINRNSNRRSETNDTLILTREPLNTSRNSNRRNETNDTLILTREPLNISRNSNRRSETNDTLILTRESLNDSRNSNRRSETNDTLILTRDSLNDSRNSNRRSKTNDTLILTREPLNDSRNSSRRSKTNDTLILTRDSLNDSRNSNRRSETNDTLILTRDSLNDSRNSNRRSKTNDTLILTREPLNTSRNSNRRSETNDTLILTRDSLNDSRDWTILMTVNNGYLDFFRNWLWHFKKLNLSTPLMVVAHDDLVYKKLKNSDLSILGKMTVERSAQSINSSVNYQTKQFNMLVGTRPQHILDYLERGKNILYIDTDTVWLQTPFQYFTGDYDLWIQLERDSSYCTGFMAVRSGSNTIELIRAWRERMIYLGNKKNDQAGFKSMVSNYSSKVKIMGLDPKKFPDGSHYFATFNAKQREDVVVVHNNYIVGHDKKLGRFKRMKLWYEDKDNGTKLQN